MLALTFQKRLDSVLRILCLGAHSDDIEIGCGGTILRLTETYPHTDITWIVFGAHGQRATEATNSAELFLKDAKEKRVIIRDFEMVFFRTWAGDQKYFEQLKQDLSPELIFTHYRHDLPGSPSDMRIDLEYVQKSLDPGI
jgi:LmbE family N-acetylglucosaminyl deacetylase